MAIDGVVHSGSQTTWGISQESTFGTAVADAGTFIQFEGPPPSIDWGLTQDLGVKNHGYRFADLSTTYNTQSGNLRVLSFSDLLVRRLDLAELLYAVTQTVTEAAGSPFQKDFEIVSTTTQPDFASNAGYFATVAIRGQEANLDRKFTSCILRNLTLNADLTGGDGRLRASGEWVSGFSANTTAEMSGTWGYNTQYYYDFSSPTAKAIDANDLVLYSWSLTINNNAGRIGNDSSGDAESYKIGIPEYEVTGSLTLKYDDNTKGLLADFLAGTEEAITLSVGSAGAAGYFLINIDNAQYTGHEKDYGEEEIVTIPFKAMGNGATDEFLDLRVDDGNDQTW